MSCAPVENHELQAVRLALAAQERRRSSLPAGGSGEPSWRSRSGSRPDTTLGRIGFEGRYDYGALGPVANLSLRLSTQAEAGQVLIGPRVFAAVEEEVETAPAGKLELKGFGRPVDAYEVLGLRNQVSGACRIRSRASA